jgi:hypothetical protein
MTLTIDTFFYILAFVFFIIDAVPVETKNWHFVSLGFAALVLTLII